MRNYQRDEYTPWSLVMPVALAVMLGILTADAIKLGVGMMMAKAAVESLNESMRKQTTSGHLPARPNVPTSTVNEPTVSYGPDAYSPERPGPIRAKQEKLDRACISGVVTLRQRNGWSQDMSTGRPQRCIATSP